MRPAAAPHPPAHLPVRRAMFLGEMPVEAPDRSEASEAGHARSDGGQNSGKTWRKKRNVVMYFSAPLLIFFPHCFKPHSVRFACLCAAHWELPSSFFLCECDEAPLSSGLFRVGDLLVACFSAAIPTGFPTKLLASVSYDGVWGTKSRSAQPGAPTAVHTGMRNARHECFLHPGGLRMPALTGGV